MTFIFRFTNNGDIESMEGTIEQCRERLHEIRMDYSVYLEVATEDMQIWKCSPRFTIVKAV